MNSDDEGVSNKKSLVVLSSDDDSLDETFYGDQVTNRVNRPIQKGIEDQNPSEEDPIPLVSAPIREDSVLDVSKDFYLIENDKLSKYEYGFEKRIRAQFQAEDISVSDLTAKTQQLMRDVGVSGGKRSNSVENDTECTTKFVCETTR